MSDKTQNVLLQWQALEFENYEKGFGWYLTFAILVVLIIFYEIFLRDYFAALTFFVISIIVYAFAKMSPAEIEIVITDKAIFLDSFEVPFANVKRFWIVDHDQAKDLHLETTAYLNRYVIVQLNDQDPEAVRDILGQFLPESEPNLESFGRRAARKLKF